MAAQLVAENMMKITLVIIIVVEEVQEITSLAERLTRMPRVREVWSSKPGPAKSYTALQTVCASTPTQVAVLPWCYDTEMGTANSLHASA